jgi:hypothetical protein
MSPLRNVIAALVLAFGVVWSAAAVRPQPAATPSVSATPGADPDWSFVLPTENQVPSGLVIISDGDRTLADVVSGFDDPLTATKQFTEWGWRGNVIRAFHLPPGAEADPNAIDGIYISVHGFSTPEDAAEALDYAFATHAADPNLKEIRLDPLGEYSRALYGKQPYGNEVTLYVQQGTYLIRLSASSPTGDPRAEAIALLQTILKANSVEREPASIALAWGSDRIIS